MVEGIAGGEMQGGEDGGFLTFLTYFFDFFDLPAARYTRFRMPISVSPPSRAFALPVSPSVNSHFALNPVHHRLAGLRGPPPRK